MRLLKNTKVVIKEDKYSPSIQAEYLGQQFIVRDHAIETKMTGDGRLSGAYVPGEFIWKGATKQMLGYATSITITSDTGEVIEFDVERPPRIVDGGISFER